MASLSNSAAGGATLRTYAEATQTMRWWSWSRTLASSWPATWSSRAVRRHSKTHIRWTGPGLWAGCSTSPTDPSSPATARWSADHSWRPSWPTFRPLPSLLGGSTSTAARPTTHCRSHPSRPQSLESRSSGPSPSSPGSCSSSSGAGRRQSRLVAGGSHAGRFAGGSQTGRLTRHYQVLTGLDPEYRREIGGGCGCRQNGVVGDRLLRNRCHTEDREPPHDPGPQPRGVLADAAREDDRIHGRQGSGGGGDALSGAPHEQGQCQRGRPIAVGLRAEQLANVGGSGGHDTEGRLG